MPIKETPLSACTADNLSRVLPILILAAGESKRFKTCKQLATDSQGLSILERCIKNCKAADVGPVYIVLGARADEIQTALITSKHAEGVQFIHNLDWARGMGSSISCGVKFITETHTNFAGVLITLADQVAIKPSYLQTLAANFKSNPSTPIASYYQNTLGPPCCFPASLAQKLIALNHSEGAKTVLQKHDAIPIAHPEAAIDIDTKSQWESWQQETKENHVD